MMSSAYELEFEKNDTFLDKRKPFHLAALNLQSLPSAKVNSALDSSRSLGSSSQFSDIDDFLQSNAKNICIDRIHLVKDYIRNVLRNECCDLQQEINSLSGSLESEVDSICSKKSKYISRMDANGSCSVGVKQPSSSDRENCIVNSKLSRKCGTCGALEQSVGSIRSKASKEYLCQQCRSKLLSSTSGPDLLESSKFKNRLQAACDEKFFLDD